MIDNEYFKQKYYKFLQKHWQTVIVPFEILRKKMLIKAVFFSSLYFIVGLIFAYWFTFILVNESFNPILFPICLFIMYCCFIKSIINFISENKKFQTKFLEKLFPLFLKPFANFKNWPKNSNTTDIIESCCFHNFDSQEDETCIFGVYNNSNIIISDTMLKLPLNGTDKPNLFKGKIIQLELNISIDNHIILTSKNETISINLKSFNTNIKELDSLLNLFSVNKNNINLINEDLWQIIKEMAKVYCAKGFILSIKNNIVIIALRQKRFLTFGSLYVSLTQLKNYDDLIKRFTVIFNIIDCLNYKFN